MVTLFKVCVWAGVAVLGFSGSTWAADAPDAGTHAAIPDITGTYELVKRVMSDGREILPPALGGLYSMSHGRRNFNIFWREDDGTLASESMITRYTLTAGVYCEEIAFTLQNNVARPGVSSDAPATTRHCSPVTLKNGRITFEPVGEGVVLSFDKDGLTATAAGQFVDHWKKVR
jgi:hypothetical protein